MQVHCTIYRAKVAVYSYSYDCCWAESLLLAQISMKSAPKIMSCSEKKSEVHRSIRCIFVVSLAGLIFGFKFC